MGRDRTKIIKLGASDLIVGLCEADVYDLLTNGFPLYHLGFLEDESVKLKTSGLSLREIGGGQLQTAHDVELEASGLEFDAAEIAELENVFKATKQTVFLIGDEESHEVGAAPVDLIPDLILDTKGKKRISLNAKTYAAEFGDAIGEGRAIIGLSTSVQTREPYRYRGFINNRIRTANQKLCLLPDVGNFGDAAKLLDASLDRNVGTLYNTPTWIYPWLRFDGVNEYGDFGDILDDDGVSDLLIELWIRVQANDGTSAYFFGKQGSIAAPTFHPGYTILRYSDNKIYVGFSNGTTYVEASSGSTVNQGVPVHIAVTVDRDGNLTVYKNTAAGTPVSFAGLSSCENAGNLWIGKTQGGGFGQVDLSRLRIYNLGPGGLPADVATIIANHYNAEKSVYGL